MNSGRITPKVALAGVQWMFFILANTIVVPITLGQLFGLPPGQIAFTLQISCILTGAVCILQALAGHRFAVMDGPSGVWWGITLSLVAAASASGTPVAEIGGGLAAGFMLAGLLMAVLGGLGFSRQLTKWFTPVVMSISLFLLAVQLIMHFFEGMLDIQPSGHMNGPVAALSVGIAVLVGILTVKGRGPLANFSMLIGITAGWIAFDLLFPSAGGKAAVHEASATPLFPWGAPRLDAGILIAAFIVGLINMSNTVTALHTAGQLYGQAPTEGQHRRSFLITGVSSIIAPLFGQLPFGTFVSSLGLLESTRILHRQALAIGGALFLALGLVPQLGQWFAALPISVGSAVLFVAYLQMFGTAFRAIQSQGIDARGFYRIAVPLLLGISIMNTPAAVFAELPLFLRPLVGNGLVVGILASVVLEFLARRAAQAQAELKLPGVRTEPLKAEG
ncbi:uracil/xanthine transporter [Paenibacillus methanolicus]|uniref:Xanthine/uracil permease n=1 Tax=Paenibacillus methanolicus TaxID=582686 RepID=A0A5S5BUP1_9BACL|nr:uracil/xanthine transporter [Paenibacillus methanolicus]TYP70737.1 xanthine/uracil permease [Paenibacillus methanolicus]